MNRILLTSDGSHTLESETFGVSYHSKYGAIQESRHVFIEAGLIPIGMEQSDIRVLEVGFGTGLNALLTLLEAQRRNWQVAYTALEAFPIDMETVEKLNYTTLLQLPDHQDLFRELHRCDWDTEVSIDPNFQVHKLRQRFEESAPGTDFDLVYFDAFSPGAQPELWEAGVLGKMYHALKPGGVLTTYCAKGSVKRQLRDLGFEVEALPGPPGKREMTRARKPRE